MTYDEIDESFFVYLVLSSWFVVVVCCRRFRCRRRLFALELKYFPLGRHSEWDGCTRFVAVGGGDGDGAGWGHHCWWPHRCHRPARPDFVRLDWVGFGVRGSGLVSVRCRLRASARSERKRKLEIRIGRYFKIWSELNRRQRSSESEFVFDVEFVAHFFLNQSELR